MRAVGPKPWIVRVVVAAPKGSHNHGYDGPYDP